MNVTYPVIEDDREVLSGKEAVLVVEEGQPEYLEQAINTALRRRDVQARVRGKGHPCR